MKKIFLATLLLLTFRSFGQTCTALGQNPGTAFPVCGSSVFSQSSVPICGDKSIPAPCANSAALFQDKNPFWYKFTCFKSGTLGFEITPLTIDDDYDWQIFDVTGRDPNDVYTDPSMFVACNWSGEGGKTGARASGTSLAVCEGLGKPTYSAMPTLVAGHEYIILISHFTNSQHGYSLSFGGGTGSIIDSTASAIATAKPQCDGQTISVKINKKMVCSSLAADGSDFSISSSTAKIVSAKGVNCSGGFDMDSILITFDRPLTPGNYTITTKKGSDQNTLLDYCSTPMAEGLSASFKVELLQPTPFDSIRAVSCAPDKLTVVFKKPIQCASIAADGSDFVMDPLSGISITGVKTNCTNNGTSSIDLILSKPITVKSNYKVTLAKGTDGNTIVDECGQETPAGGFVIVSGYDTVSAAFQHTIQFGCKADTVKFFHNGDHGANVWQWKFNDRGTSAQQNPVVVFTKFGPQQVYLLVSNGVCRDSANITFQLDNELKADFTGPTLLCPEDDMLCKDGSIGKVSTWNWDFGNGSTSTLKDPPIQKYLPVNTTSTYPVKLVVKNDLNCFDTITKQVTVLSNCYIAVATAFTPNNDGLNDYLYPINAFKATKLLFRVYNRLGQLVFETTDFTKKWDGTFKGIPQPSGTYVYTLQYTHADTGQPFSTKGTSVLLR